MPSELVRPFYFPKQKIWLPLVQYDAVPLIGRMPGYDKIWDMGCRDGVEGLGMDLGRD